MEVFHMRKLTSISVALVVAAGTMMATPATAAIKIANGVACTKLGAVKTANGSKYKCAKNQLSTSTKLTWLSIDCIASATSYVRVRKAASEISAQLAAQIPVIDLGIANEITNKAEIQTKVDDANLRLEAAKVKLAAAKTDAAKKSLTAAVNSWTAAVRAYTSKINSIALNIRKLEAAKLLAINKPVQLAADVADAKAGAQLLCTKGF